MEVFILLSYCRITRVSSPRSRASARTTHAALLAFYSIIIVVFFEAIAVSWLYGIQRISDDVQEMLGSKPGKFWLGTWCFAAPLFLAVSRVEGR